MAAKPFFATLPALCLRSRMRLLDTQIISYAMKGKWPNGCRDGRIASITALEFLLVQGNSATKAHYYVPLPGCFGFHPLAIPHRDHPFGKQSTDQLLLDFANEFPTVIEFSNLAVSQVINLGLRDLFTSTTEHLEKKERKTIRSRFDYLLSEGITSIPLSRGAISTGLELLSQFAAQFRTKQNVRNTINDIFILATAIDASAELITKDSTLARFAADVFRVGLQSHKGYIVINFSRSINATRKAAKESKGYIHRGWQFHLRNYGGHQAAA